MIESIAQKIELNDGNFMPGYGYGCYKAKGEELLLALGAAWQAGYRLYDTAAYYDNEETVGQGLNNYPASEMFVVSKIWPSCFDNPVKSLDRSLKKLEADYLDAYLLHWPGTEQGKMLKCYEALLKEKEKGKILSLGVSNFLEHHLEDIRAHFDFYPAINQIEIHPYFQQSQLCAFCNSNKIAIMAWAPLGRGREINDATIDKIAKELGKQPAQVILRWQIQSGRVAIPKSVHADRIRANADVFNFSLSEQQMNAIAALDKPDNAGRTGADPNIFNGEK